MPIGKMTMWNSDRGFGFIRAEDGSAGSYTFVHVSELAASGIRDCAVGDVFEYAVREARDNRTQAADLVCLHRLGDQ
ncbi:MAG: cold-shock protein [Devosia sp.]